MRLQIRHTTTFTYDEPISEAYTEMRLSPMETGGQRCLRFRLSTEPKGEVMAYSDRYGNLVHHFDTLQSHDRVVVTAISEVETSDRFLDPGELSPLDEFDYLSPTRYTPTDDEIVRLAREHVVPGDRSETVTRLMNAVYNSMKYEPGATDVKTTAAESLRLRRGVCQDFAHVMLAACRSIEIPARYVSGYLYNPGLIEERREAGMIIPTNAASHAWLDVYLPDEGWISIDPTHTCWQTASYVRVAIGRDYADVSPTKGIYKGTAAEKLSVNVVVKAS